MTGTARAASGASAIEVDEARWPLLRVRWPRSVVGPEELDAFAERADRELSRGAAIAILVDARGAAPLGPGGLARAIAIERRQAARAREVVVGRALLLDHALAVRIVSAALRAIGPRVPTRAFSDEPPAIAWLEGELARRGLASRSR